MTQWLKDQPALARVWKEREGRRHSRRLDATRGKRLKYCNRRFPTHLKCRLALPLLTQASRQKILVGRESRRTRWGRLLLGRNRIFQQTATVVSTMRWPGAGSSTRCSGSSSWWLTSLACQLSWCCCRRVDPSGSTIGEYLETNVSQPFKVF